MKLKKVLAAILAASMIMGMSVTTFAADITITNPEDVNDATYTYMQIVEPDPSSPIGWKFVDESDTDTQGPITQAFIDGLNATDADDAIEKLKDIYNESSANYNAEQGVVNASSDLGDILNSIQNRANEPVIANTIETSEAGLYLIVGHKTGYTWIPMLAYVDNDDDGSLVNAEVTAKASKDQVKKVVDQTGQSVMEGDKVTYTVTAEYPYYADSDAEKKFVITDKLGNATFEDDYNLQVKIDGKPVTQGFVQSLSADKTELTINFTYDQQYAGKTVEITYVATVGKVDDKKPLSNDVTSTIDTGSTKEKVVSDSASFTVTKTGDDNTLLGGAEFTLYVADENSKTEIDDPENEGQKVKVSIVETLTTSDLEDATKGTATFDGLDAQKTYYVKETKAPTGYSLLETVYKLDGASVSGPVESTEVEGDVTFKVYTYECTDFTGQSVKDTKLSKLPSTGGIGTTIFTIGGCTIMIAAAGLYFASRRKQENK